MSENKNPTAEKYAALEAENEQLVTKSAEKDAIIAEQHEQISSLEAENVQLVTKSAEKDAIIAEQHEQISSLEAENVQLKAAIAKSNAGTKKAEKVKAPEKIKVDGKNYKFVLNEFHVPGHGKMTAAQMSQDEAALSTILDIKGQTILKEIK